MSKTISNTIPEDKVRTAYERAGLTQNEEHIHEVLSALAAYNKTKKLESLTLIYNTEANSLAFGLKLEDSEPVISQTIFYETTNKKMPAYTYLLCSIPHGMSFCVEYIGSIWSQIPKNPLPTLEESARFKLLMMKANIKKNFPHMFSDEKYDFALLVITLLHPDFKNENLKEKLNNEFLKANRKLPLLTNLKPNILHSACFHKLYYNR